MALKKPISKVRPKVKAKAKPKPRVATKTDPATSKRLQNWMSLMADLDTKMPRHMEDVYDTLIANGMPLDSFPIFVQEAYKAKKAARSKRPS